MRFDIAVCICGALKSYHVGGSGHCEAGLKIVAHAACECLKFKRVNARTNKFNAEGTAGFRSKGEREEYRILQTLEAGGGITDLKHEPQLPVEPPNCTSIIWKPDFTYYDDQNRFVIEDYKGAITEAQEGFRIKLALAQARYPDAVFRLSYKVRGLMRVADPRTARMDMQAPSRNWRRGRRREKVTA